MVIFIREGQSPMKKSTEIFTQYGQTLMQKNIVFIR